MAESVMTINTKADWDGILAGGAVVLYETKLCKIFRMPDGSLWRAMPKWRKAWPIEIVDNCGR